MATSDGLALLNAAIVHIPAILTGIIIIAATAALARAARRSAGMLAARTVRSNSLRLLIEKSAHVGTWVAGALLAALVVFPGLRLGDVVATLGLTSVAVGFAFQDIFKNFLAGVLLLINEPFRIGDQIIVDQFEGTVERVDIRTTNIRTYAGERILIPNSTIFTSPVQVRTAYDARRTDVTVGIDELCDLDRALTILNDVLIGVDGVLPDPAPHAEIIEIGESSINVALRFWHTPQNAQMIRTRTRVIAAVQRALIDAGIDMPYPIRTVLLPEREVAAR